jgi:hypothetical protein
MACGNYSRAVVEVDNFLFILCETRIKRYEEEVKRLEERLASSTHTEFWNVKTYFNHCRENAAEDDDIRSSFRQNGFDSLADKYGLAWIRQIYLPRVKASCLRNR